MYCPVCKCEFRSGFSRCESCDVDLVENIQQETTAPNATPAPACGPGEQLVDYCGFLDLDDGRRGREDLRRRGIKSEIVIRDPVGMPLDSPGGEEYWLRVPLQTIREVTAILGYDASGEDCSMDSASGFTCSECGAGVPSDESFCPKCGTRFEVSL